MASPVYIICAESGSEDSFTGMASLFNIIDAITIREMRLDVGGESGIARQGSPSIRIVAVWRADHDADFDRDFECEMRLIVEPQGTENMLFTQTFRFMREKPRHRITTVIGALDLRGGSALTVEARIRPQGEESWISQSYTIDVDVERAVNPEWQPANP
jgi:hypothetical protein